MINLIHSYQYINFNNIKCLQINNNIITDENNNKLIGLCNIPDNKEIYNCYINKLLTKKKSIKNNFFKKSIRNEVNLSINIKIDIDRIYNLIKLGETIPDVNLLFKLIRRNIKKYEENYQFKDIKDNIFSKLLNDINNIFINNLIKLEKLFFNYEEERIYLKYDEMVKYENIKKGNVIISNPYGSLRNTICNSNNKICIICKNENINKWNNMNIKKINLKNLDTYSDHEFKENIIQIPINIFYNTKYKNLWNLYSNNNQSKKNILNNLDLLYTRNKFIHSPLLFHLIQYDYLIFDDCVDSKLIENFNFKNLVYFTENSKISVKSINNIIYELFNVSVNNLNKDIIYKNIIEEKFNYKNNKIEKNYINLNTYDERFLLDNIKLDDINLYNSLELNITKTNYIIHNKLHKLDKCCICLDTIKSDNIGKLECSHIFCYSCLKKLDINIPKCPICRSKYTEVYKIIKGKKDLSKKLQYLLELNNSVIFSKYEESIINLEKFYNAFNIKCNILKKKELLKKNNNYLIFYDDYKLIDNNFNDRNIYCLEEIENDYYINSILSKLKINKINVINCSYSNNLFK